MHRLWGAAGIKTLQLTFNPPSLSLLPPHLLPKLDADTVCEYEVQFHQRLDQERAQWNQYREAVERELGELRRRLSEGQEEENLEDDMKRVSCVLLALVNIVITVIMRGWCVVVIVVPLDGNKGRFSSLLSVCVLMPESRTFCISLSQHR